MGEKVSGVGMVERAVVVEGEKEAPILWETEGQHTSKAAAYERLKRLLGQGNYFRGCVVRLEYVSGNKAVLHAMKGMQE